jgi:hypothetical protein
MTKRKDAQDAQDARNLQIDMENLKRDVDVAKLNVDVSWLKAITLTTLAAVLTLHFLDPSFHYWVFQFP